MAEHVLQPEHDQQLTDYLRFLRRKRDAAIAEVGADFRETQETRLFDENYTIDDVAAIIDGLQQQVKSTMKRDLQTTMFSSVLLMKQCFEEAEKASASLHTDLPCTEDRRLLQEVERWDEDVHGGRGGGSLRARAAIDNRRPSALPTIGQTQDPRLLSDLNNARDDNATLQERFAKLQVTCTSALRDKSALQAQVEALTADAAAGGGHSAEVDALRAEVEALKHEVQAAFENGLRQAQQDAGAGSDELMRELHREQETNRALSADLEATRAELDGRLERSAPFVNLRQMLSKKNNLVRQLREQMRSHGIYVDDIDPDD